MVNPDTFLKDFVLPSIILHYRYPEREDPFLRERIQQHAYHWWDDYERQLWLFEPPEQLKALYQSISRQEADREWQVWAGEFRGG